MSNQAIRYRAKRIDSERFGMDMWVTGHYFTAPLTDENSGAPAEAGWYFLAGPDQPTRHLIVDGGTAFTIDQTTLEPVAEDFVAALEQNDALRAEVLKAVLPSALEMAQAIYRNVGGFASDTGDVVTAWELLRPGYRTALVEGVKAFREHLGVADE